MTLAKNMFGDDGTATLAMILPFIVTLFNVFAVVILSVYAPADAKLSPAALAKRIVKTVATNPLIISIVLALVWRLTGLSMPVLMSRSLGYLSDMSMPLALISLGANFRLESLHGRVGLAVGLVCLQDCRRSGAGGFRGYGVRFHGNFARVCVHRFRRSGGGLELHYGKADEVGS